MGMTIMRIVAASLIDRRTLGGRGPDGISLVAPNKSARGTGERKAKRSPCRTSWGTCGCRSPCSSLLTSLAVRSPAPLHARTNQMRVGRRKEQKTKAENAKFMNLRVTFALDKKVLSLSAASQTGISATLCVNRSATRAQKIPSYSHSGARCLNHEISRRCPSTKEQGASRQLWAAFAHNQTPT